MFAKPPSSSSSNIKTSGADIEGKDAAERKKSEKDTHDAREATKAAEKAAELERRIGIT